jgi:pimeloyl-ACP methyl ester carboxylesterase
VTASDGIKLAAHISGDGPPLYVLHSGPVNDHRTFGDYLDPIAEYRTLHLLDQRGCGDSDDAPADARCAGLISLPSVTASPEH